MPTGHDILFHFPQAKLLFLCLIPFFIGQIALTRYRKKQQHIYSSPFLLQRLLIPRSPLLSMTKLIGWTLIWIFICLSLMSPFGNIRYSSLSSQKLSKTSAQSLIIPHQIIFLVDTSASMLVPDSSNNQTRLEQAKNIMEDLLRNFQGQIVSLYAFTSELTPVVPPTLDYMFTRLAIKDLQIDQGDVSGTRFMPVLKSLKEQALSNSALQYYTIIMLTDGGDTQLESLTGTAKKQKTEEILNAILDPRQLHIRLFTVGLGSFKPHPIPHVTFDGKPVLSKLESEILQQLAEHERGTYYTAEEWTSWDLARGLMSQIEEDYFLDSQGLQNERKVASIEKEDVLTDLYYQIPLGLAILFYFLNLLIPDVHYL